MHNNYRFQPLKLLSLQKRLRIKGASFWFLPLFLFEKTFGGRKEN